MPIGPCLVGNVQNFWDVFVHRILILRMNWLMFSGEISEILISLDETANLFVVVVNSSYLSVKLLNSYKTGSREPFLFSVGEIQ